MFRRGGPSGLMPNLTDVIISSDAVICHPFFGNMDNQYQTVKSDRKKKEANCSVVPKEVAPLFYGLIATDFIERLVSACFLFIFQSVNELITKLVCLPAWLSSHVSACFSASPSSCFPSQDSKIVSVLSSLTSGGYSEMYRCLANLISLGCCCSTSLDETCAGLRVSCKNKLDNDKEKEASVCTSLLLLGWGIYNI